MAIVKNFWLRDNAQKLGGAVIYQAKGQTLMRQLAPSISNPRTDAQMVTRVKLANLVAFYRASAKWMRGAFETKESNQSDYNAFVSANSSGNQVWLTKSQVDAGNAVVAPYQVSRGSLGEIVQTASSGIIKTNLYLGSLTLSAGTTISQFTTALLANNLGLAEGDQLSVVQYIQNTGSDGNYTITCRAYEVILSTLSTELLSAYLPIDLLEASADASPALQMITTGFTGGAAFIVSRTIGGKILVSSASVTLTSPNNVYTAMTSTTQQQNAITSYGTQTEVFLDSAAANEANSSVATSPQIIALTVGAATYAPGDIIPSEYDNADTIIVTMSAPVTINTDGYLRIDPSADNPIEGEMSYAGLTTGTIFPYKIVSTSTLQTPASGTRPVVVQITLNDETVITQSFAVGDDGLE